MKTNLCVCHVNGLNMNMLLELENFSPDKGEGAKVKGGKNCARGDFVMEIIQMAQLFLSHLGVSF